VNRNLRKKRNSYMYLHSLTCVHIYFMPVHRRTHTCVMYMHEHTLLYNDTYRHAAYIHTYFVYDRVQLIRFWTKLISGTYAIYRRDK
jgi:hypothetical protein